MIYKLQMPVGTLMQRMTTNEGATLMSVDVFHRDIVEGRFRKEIETIRKVAAEGTMVTQKVNGVERQIALYDKLKKELPYFVPQADVRKRRLWEEACNFSGFVPVDIDHLTAEKVEQVMQWARRQTWVKEAHRSSRGEGVHLIVAMGIVEATSKVDYEQEYKRRYAIISQYIRQQTGLGVDGQCKDVLRGFFMSYDPQAYLRKDSEVSCFDYPEEMPTENVLESNDSRTTLSNVFSNNNNAKPMEMIANINERLVSTFLRYHIYKPDGRHSWWINLAQYLRFKGVPRDLLAAYREVAKGKLLAHNLILHDDPLLRSANEVEEAMAWGYDHAEEPSEADKTSTRKKNKAADKEKEDKPIVMQQVHDQLSAMACFRFNMITEQVEVLEKDKWQEMDDALFLTYYDRVKLAGIRTNKSDVEAAIRSFDFTPRYNPVEEYLNSCQEWDETQPDYITELFSYLVFENEEERKFALPLLRKWFITMVALWLGLVDDNQMMPVLRGAQNIGKSHFYRHLLPPELRQYYKELQPGDRLDKDQRIAMSRFLLIAFEEFTLSERNSANQTKAFISTAASTDREAYGHFQKVRRRRASLIASCNDEKYITDPKGSRRYLTVSILNTKHIEGDTLPYCGAYAQALWYCHYRKPSQYRPTKPEADAITLHNKPYTQRTMTELFVERMFRKPRRGEQGKSLTMADILSKLSFCRLSDLNEINVGTALRQLGIQKKHTKKGNRYYVVEITPDVIEEEARQIGADEYKQLEEEEIRRNSESDIPFDENQGKEKSDVPF